jgi:hypothetical protein
LFAKRSSKSKSDFEHMVQGRFFAFGFLDSTASCIRLVVLNGDFSAGVTSPQTMIK